MSLIPMPLWAAVDQYNEEIISKVHTFLQWLSDIENKAPENIQVAINMIYEEPFTAGGPFVHVPKAIVSGTVLYRGFAFKTPTSGKESERRAMTLGLQSMQTTPDPAAAVRRILHNLTWYSRPESDLLPS